MSTLTLDYEVENWEATTFMSQRQVTHEVQVPCPNIVMSASRNAVYDCVDIVAQLYLGHKVPVAPPTVVKKTKELTARATAVARAVAKVTVEVPTRLGVLFPWLPKRWTTRTVTRWTEVYEAATATKTESLDVVNASTTVMVIDPTLQFGPGKPYTIRRARHEESRYVRMAEVFRG